ncbi:MAG: hypothetical protein E8D46_10490 [Nitrospira sp.]|nr:MAG: hypothetical protein E8D46_10490 [Nitrospira sp.]
MLTRRALFKIISTLGFSAMLPGKIFGEHMSVLSSISQRRDLTLDGEGATPLTIQTLDELLDSVDCMELAERYGSFEKVGGYLGGFLARICLFCSAGKLYVHPNDFRCDKCEAAGTTLDFFARMEGITDEEAMQRLAVLVKCGSLHRRGNEQKVLWGIMSEASRYYHHILCETKEGEPGRDWLKKHGVTAGMREELYLGYFPRCRNGIQTELIEHLVGQGHESDIVQSAILPHGHPGIVLPIGDAQGHWWGLLKRSLGSEEETLYYSNFLGMQRLAPRLCKKLASRCGTHPGALANTAMMYDPPDDYEYVSA